MSSSASGAASPESGGDVPYTVPLRDTAQSALEASASAGAAGSLHAFGAQGSRAAACAGCHTLRFATLQALTGRQSHDSSRNCENCTRCCTTSRRRCMEGALASVARQARAPDPETVPSHRSFQQFKVPERGTEQGDEDSFLKQFPSAFLAEAQQFKNMVEAVGTVQETQAKRPPTAPPRLSRRLRDLGNT